MFWIDHEGEPETDFALPSGWYWIAGFPGCSPDSDEPNGPFATSTEAFDDAQDF